MTNITMPYKTNGAHIMENLDMLFILQLCLFTFFFGSVIRLFIHLLISSEHETK